MSKSTQVEFERLVEKYYRQNTPELMLTAPTFEKSGFLTIATMLGSGGQVKMRCGPAAYEAEIFINTFQDEKRWSLADLMKIETVRDWILQNPSIVSEKPKLEIEVEAAFRLLCEGLRGDARFDWVTNNS
ncbi:MAG: hypothetical protein IT366_18345 [Candidatus Hydrogenedentes bacterium]|nr:hypothetical protein [Candidatus Hydrogenedentota bacterium]